MKWRLLLSAIGLGAYIVLMQDTTQIPALLGLIAGVFSGAVFPTQAVLNEIIAMCEAVKQWQMNQ